MLMSLFLFREFFEVMTASSEGFLVNCLVFFLKGLCLVSSFSFYGFYSAINDFGSSFVKRGFRNFLLWANYIPKINIK
jgi:hypothetical protein